VAKQELLGRPRKACQVNYADNFTQAFPDPVVPELVFEIARQRQLHQAEPGKRPALIPYVVINEAVQPGLFGDQVPHLVELAPLERPERLSTRLLGPPDLHLGYA
jgi:hypothetical protein